MKFTPLASSSRGNAYLLQSDWVSPLLLEAGLPIKQLRDKLREHGVSLSDLVGCLISHEHMDHAKAVKDLLKAGVDCFMSPLTANVLGVEENHRSISLMEGITKVIPIGFIRGGCGWKIFPFGLEHDAVDPYGFLIGQFQDDDCLLFIPDTAYVHNRFTGVTLLAVECNNVSELVSKNILEGNIPPVIGRRIRRNHMSLENLIAMLKANDLSKCRQILLMHLSDGNSDEQRMILEVQAATGIPCIACGE